MALRTLRPLAAYLRHLGKDASRLLTAAGVDPLGLFEPNAYIPAPLMLTIWRGAEELCADPSFGLRVIGQINFRLLESMQYETEWVVIQMFAASSTVGEGLARLARYFPVGFYGSRIIIDRREGAVRVRHVAFVREVPRSFAEFIIGLIARQIHELARGPVRMLEVRFAHSAPPSLSVHERLLAAPTRFEAGEDAILLDVASLKVPLRSANPALVVGLEQHGDRLLAQLPPLESIVDQVRALITAELHGGNPSAGYIAGALRMSVRTLSRRLEEFGTSHKALLDEVRAELSRRYLLEDRRAVSEVAELLGFSEVSAFHRAFRRWYGQSPTVFRRTAPRT